MQIYTLGLALLACLPSAYADPVGHEWQAPGPADSRAPCPMLNALANHGYLPRNGQNITADVVYAAFNESINFNNSILVAATEAALTMSTTGYNTTFNLADTVEHDIIEHDASLSRQDLYFGDNLHFNATIWANVTAFFTADPITVDMAAKARAARIEQAQAINPTFYFPEALEENQLSETALYLVILGDADGSAPASYVEALFVDERLPYTEGFQRSTEVITADDIQNMEDLILAVQT